MKIELTGYRGDPNDCYNRALPDEPVFKLLARDPQSPALVRKWATDREAKNDLPNEWVVTGGDNFGDTRTSDWVKPPHPDADMIAHARYLAARMEVWRYENDGKWRLPSERDFPPSAADLRP